MFSFLHTQEKLILTGNLLFIVCCGCYLAWWLLAFKPSGAVANTGWLLIPATIAGLLGVVLAVQGIVTKSQGTPLFPSAAILWGGVAAYLILLAVTVGLLKRPATTELILIVGWGMLALAEVNALFAAGLFSRRLSVGFILASCAAVVISLVCYVLYYRLDSRAGYIDGLIPLVLAAAAMGGIGAVILGLGKR